MISDDRGRGILFTASGTGVCMSNLLTPNRVFRPTPYKNTL